MAAYFLLSALACVVVSAAPPAPPRLYPQGAPAHLHALHPLDYFSENTDAAYYHQAQQKQGSAPARLENLEPDSEVELLPGAQQPQQPPQQNPVSPNIPGLVPGQRVFIVHMPVPGYTPGSIGGYQPVYIVAAAPQANAAYPNANGYQNAVLLNPGGHYSPFLGYPGAGGLGQVPVGPVAPVGQVNPVGQLGQLGHVGQVNQPRFLVGLNRPYESYQDAAVVYQSGPQPLAPEGGRGVLSQLNQAAPARPNSQEAAAPNPKRVGEAEGASEELKEEPRAPRLNARPAPTHPRKP